MSLTPTLRTPGEVVTPAGLRLLQSVAVVQAIFYVLAGVWPMVNMETFLAVTGPKTDLWQVRTVGLLVTVIGVTLFAAVWRDRITPEITLLAVGAALCLAGIDLTHVSLGAISPIYLADAAVELLLVAGWGVARPR